MFSIHKKDKSNFSLKEKKISIEMTSGVNTPKVNKKIDDDEKEHKNQPILQIYPEKKYERVPTAEEANFLLFSVHPIEYIQYYITRFPEIEKQKHNNMIKGVSATLTWSGKPGFNIPVATYEDQSIGFVINDRQITVPQADLFAYRSFSTIAKESLKKGKIEGELLKSKYPEKQGYFRQGYGGFFHFCTNLARNEHVSQSPEKKAIYHKEGKAEIFAKNIWRKFIKHPDKYREHRSDGEIMNLNEAIVFQKGDKNPIAGLFITTSPDLKTAQALLAILQKHPPLKLYFYKTNAKEHIVRYLDNLDGQKYLQDNIKYRQKNSSWTSEVLNFLYIDNAFDTALRNVFNNTFEKAAPFTGFAENSVKLDLVKKGLRS